MARIPFAAIQGGTATVAAPPLQSATAPADPSAGVGAMAAARGLALGVEVADRFFQARNSVAVSDAVLDSSDKLDAFRQDLAQDGDHATREARFQRRLNEERDEKLQGLGDPRARDDFRIRFNRVARSMQAQVRNQAREEETQLFRMKLGENLDTLANKVVLTRNVQEREGYQLEAQAAIEDAVRTGRLSAHGARAMQRAYLGKVDGALAAEMIRSDPAGAIAALGDPEKFRYLDASQRVNLRAQATQRAESLSAQARVELRGDAQDLTAAMAQGQPVDPAQVQALIRRAGPNSAIGAGLQRSWEFFQRVQVETTGRNIPQLAAAIGRLERGEPVTHDGYAAPRAADGRTMTELAITVSDPRLNGGRPTNIPALWGGRPVGDDEAVRRALASGRPWPSFDTPEQADVAALARAETQDAAPAGAARPPTAQDLHLARALKTALGRKIEERDRDPAAYALANYPTIAEDLVRADQLQAGGDETAAQDAPALRRRAWQTMESVQAAEGVPAHRIALLTRPQAEALQAQLLGAEGQARVDLVQQLKHTYGDSWARAWNQIGDGKPMPGDVQVIAALPREATLQATIVAEAFRLQDRQAAEVLGSEKIGAVDKAVRAQTGPMAGTMAQAPGGPEFLATYQNAAEKVARLLVIRGEGVETAARRAADIVFYDHWEVVDRARVPKVNGQPIVPASAVRAAQRQVVEALPQMELAVPAGDKGTTEASRKDALVRNVRSFGAWMTTADDKGLVLMAGPGLPVLHKDGRPLMLGFDGVLAAAGNAAAAANLDLRRALQNEGLTVDEGSDPAPPAAGGPAWLQDLVGRDLDIRQRRAQRRQERRQP